MTLMKHEMKLGRTALIIWTLAIGLMLAVCVLIYPEMKMMEYLKMVQLGEIII